MKYFTPRILLVAVLAVPIIVKTAPAQEITTLVPAALGERTTLVAPSKFDQERPIGPEVPYAELEDLVLDLAELPVLTACYTPNDMLMRAREFILYWLLVDEITRTVDALGWVDTVVQLANLEYFLGTNLEESVAQLLHAIDICGGDLTTVMFDAIVEIMVAVPGKLDSNRVRRMVEDFAEFAKKSDRGKLPAPPPGPPVTSLDRI